MSVSAQSELRTCAFGDLDAGVWGIACAPTDQGRAVAYFGKPDAAAPVPIDPVSFEATELGRQWSLRGDGIELDLSPAGEPALIELSEHGVEVGSQLCVVHGRLVLDGSEREIDCFGQLGTRAGPSNPARLHSLREVLAWFGPDEGLALVSLRSPHADGHDRDTIAGVLFQEGSRIDVADPRLSTTYTADGQPARASLELWLDEPDGDPTDPDAADADPDADQPGAPNFPRRAAGESVGARAQIAVSGLDMQAVLFRWHMSGHDGAGVYVLAHPA